MKVAVTTLTLWEFLICIDSTALVTCVGNQCGGGGGCFIL